MTINYNELIEALESYPVKPSSSDVRLKWFYEIALHIPDLLSIVREHEEQQMSNRKKPTIEELEKIMDDSNISAELLPTGEVKTHDKTEQPQSLIRMLVEVLQETRTLRKESLQGKIGHEVATESAFYKIDKMAENTLSHPDLAEYVEKK